MLYVLWLNALYKNLSAVWAAHPDFSTFAKNSCFRCLLWSGDSLYYNFVLVSLPDNVNHIIYNIRSLP